MHLNLSTPTFRRLGAVVLLGLARGPLGHWHSGREPIPLGPEAHYFRHGNGKIPIPICLMAIGNDGGK